MRNSSGARRNWTVIGSEGNDIDGEVHKEDIERRVNMRSRGSMSMGEYRSERAGPVSDCARDD